LFLPPYHLILAQLGIDPAAPPDKIAIPRPLLELIMRCLLLQLPFDEANYLRRNDDVRASVERGEISSGHQHFVATGYFEGRSGGIRVDEDWYLKAYADVADAVANGLIASATDHYAAAGAEEWRVPSLGTGGAVAAWRSALGAAAPPSVNGRQAPQRGRVAKPRPISSGGR
jgi:hypothetical protein